MFITLLIQMEANNLFHLYLSLNSLIMVMTALPRSFLSLHTMLTPTPEGKVPAGTFREIGQWLQFTEEDWVWIPLASQLSILNQTICPQVVLSHK